MYSKKFEKVFKYVIANEGSYVFDKNDPGGETKYGISKMAYKSLNIKGLTIEQAKEIYWRDYWKAGKIDEIFDIFIAAQLLDFSVNLGIRGATIVLQRALRAGGIIVQEDGLIGPETLSATKNLEPPILLAAMKAEAAGYYRVIAAKNPSQRKFLSGWLNRAYKKI